MTATPERELLYFNIRGRAEQIRLLLEYTRTPYKDTSLTRDQWMSLKPTLPLGQLPLLIERSGAGEVTIPQSVAIVRHLARTLDVYGTDERQRTMCDVIADTINDARTAFNRVAYYPHFLKDKEATAQYFRETLPPVLPILSTLRAQSTSPEAGFFIGQTPTFADIMAFDTLDALLQVEPGCLDNHPDLQQFVRRVSELPDIAGYLARRRPSDLSKVT